jgi:hypothetical protein
MGGFSRLGVAAALIVTCAGCFHINYVPAGVEQRIGANLLVGAPRTWRCEGGERFASIEDGKGLFIASRDFIVRNPEPGDAADRFSYTTDLAYGTLVAEFFVPHDDGPLYASYATPYASSFYSASGTIGDMQWISKSQGLMLPRIAMDRCWRDEPGVDAAAEAAAAYVGAKPYMGQPPENARHYIVGLCASNEENSGWTGKPNLTRKDVALAVMFTGAMAGAENSVKGPQDIWVADGRVVVLRPDGTGFELTHPTEYLGEKGWVFERAGVPWFVKLTDQAMLYVFRPGPGGTKDEPAPLPSGQKFEEQFVVACMIEAAR